MHAKQTKTRFMYKAFWRFAKGTCLTRSAYRIRRRKGNLGIGFGFLYEYLCWSSPRGWASVFIKINVNPYCRADAQLECVVYCSQLARPVAKTDKSIVPNLLNCATLRMKIGYLSYIPPLYTTLSY